MPGISKILPVLMSGPRLAFLQGRVLCPHAESGAGWRPAYRLFAARLFPRIGPSRCLPPSEASLDLCGKFRLRALIMHSRWLRWLKRAVLGLLAIVGLAALALILINGARQSC